MKTKSIFFKIAIAAVIAIFVLNTNQVFGQEDLLNHNNWIVNNPIANNIISSDQTICSGCIPAGLTGTIPTGGNGYYTYQWQVSTGGSNGPFANITGATGQYYAPMVLTLATWYRRVVMSANSTNSYSNVLLITVLPMIANNIISADQTIISGNIPAGLTGNIPTGGNGTYTYQWQNSNNGAGGPFTGIAGATGQNYQPPALMQTNWYRRVVSSPPVRNSISNVVTITVNPSDIIPACQVVGINTWGKNIKLQLFPNPADDFIELKLDGYSGNIKLSLMNNQGKTMYTDDRFVNEGSFTMKIDLAKFSKGVYFLQIIANNSIRIYKIIKQ